jgi:hypothetical protein
VLQRSKDWKFGIVTMNQLPHLIADCTFSIQYTREIQITIVYILCICLCLTINITYSNDSRLACEKFVYVYNRRGYTHSRLRNRISTNRFMVILWNIILLSEQL